MQCPMVVPVWSAEGILQPTPLGTVMSPCTTSVCGLPPDAGGHDVQWLAVPSYVFWCWNGVLRVWQEKEIY